MNTEKWIRGIIDSEVKKPMPVLSFPGIQMMNGLKVNELVTNSELQAKCMKAIADKYDALAAVTLMDLSVEAEAFGSPIVFSDNEVPTVVRSIVKDLGEAEKLKVPAVGAARTGEYIKTVREAKKLIGDRPVFAGGIGPFSLSGRLLDMTEIMILSMTEPEIVHTVLEKAAQFITEYVKELKQAGADGIVFAEPAAGLLSPDLNREFSVKYLKQIVAEIKSEDFVIVYHNCGNTIPLIKDILNIGADILHFGNAIDLSQMLPLVPDTIPVCGNIDPASQFRNGTPESITAATLEIMEKCGAYKNYIPSSGCDIPPMAPLENIEAFFNAVQKYYGKM